MKTSFSNLKLPIEDALPDLRRQLNSHANVVLQAPPGAGKTTLVPLALLDEPWLLGRKIIMLEPRRLAARASAARMAKLLDEPIGQTVGFRVRFESKISGRTRIEVVTEGILARRLQSDPALEDVGLVIFDEFHERHLHADLALALSLDAKKNLREDLKILVMSATLDGAALSKLLNAPVVTSEGRMFPVSVEYAARDPDGPIFAAVAQTVLRALSEHEGDALAFLPGAFEIRRAHEILTNELKSNVQVYPLYGDLPWEIQDRALQPNVGVRKVVLATPIAETSLTIEGVRVVVDSGLVRVPQFDPASGLSRLTTQRISRASSEQRAGRAGRLSSGVCYRLWTETTQRGLIAQSIPEIRSADLAPLALELCAWGVRDPAELSWLDTPPVGAYAQALDLLRELDALDEGSGITALGRTMARLPLHPRLSHMIAKADAIGLGKLACDIAALISERDIFVSRRDESGSVRPTVDLGERLEALKAMRHGGKSAVRAYPVDPNGAERVLAASRQFEKWLSGNNTVPATADAAGLLVAFAYPDRVGQRRGTETRYRLSGGRGARLPVHESKLHTPYLAVANLDMGTTEGQIYLAAPLSPDDLRQHFASHVNIESLVRWEEHEAAVASRREERFGNLVLERKPLLNPDAELLKAAMLEGVRQLMLEALPWTREAREWQARVLCLRAWKPDENWPDVTDAALTQTLHEWLAPFLDGVTRREHLSKLDLLSILSSRLDWSQSQRLEVGAPTHLTVPSGSRHRLEYKLGESPVLAVKLQEMFGLADTPRVGFGQVPVTLHLLSPARRPIQVTQDLKGFWERTYAEVKKEMKGRYPKHPWPDDPYQAPATAKTKKWLERKTRL